MQILRAARRMLAAGEFDKVDTEVSTLAALAALAAPMLLSANAAQTLHRTADAAPTLHPCCTFIARCAPHAAARARARLRLCATLHPRILAPTCPRAHAIAPSLHHAAVYPRRLLVPTAAAAAPGVF